MSAILDQVVAKELERLAAAVAAAEEKVAAAEEKAGSEDLANEALAGQRQGIEDLLAFVEDELKPLGNLAVIDPRPDAFSGRTLEDVYDAGKPFDSIRERLIDLLEVAGYPVTSDVAMFGMRRPTRNTIQELGNQTVEGLVAWLEANHPTVSSAGDAAEQQLDAARGELDKARDELAAFGDSEEEHQAWLRENGVIVAEDLPAAERQGFTEASMSPGLADAVETGRLPRYDFGTISREAPSTVTVPEPSTVDERGAGHPKYDFGTISREAPSELTDPPAPTDPSAPVDVYAALYGYGARFLTTDPNDALFDVAEILRRAAAEAWDYTKLQQAISQTDWFVQTVPRSRELLMLESTDPAAARVLIDTEADKIRMAAQSLGLVIDDERINQIARRSHIEQWSSYEIGQNMLLEANWEPGQTGGMVEDNLVAVNAMAGDYMVGHLLTDDSRQGWAEKLYLGDETAESLGAEFSRLAKSAFPMLTDKLDKGYTMQEILSPYRAEIARHLELLDPSGIDFVNDEKYQPFLYGTGVDGTSMLTIADVGEYIRTDARTRPLWERTGKAKSDARAFSDFIGRKFGGLG